MYDQLEPSEYKSYMYFLQYPSQDVCHFPISVRNMFIPCGTMLGCYAYSRSCIWENVSNFCQASTNPM